MTHVRVTGGSPLKGRCTVQGSKNAGVLLCAASLLVDDQVELDNLPEVTDVLIGTRIGVRLGATISRAAGRLCIGAHGLAHSDIDRTLGRRIRHTPSFAAAVLSRLGQVTFPLPGGDNFCDRPINLHIEAMRRAGAEISEEDGLLRARLAGARPRAFNMSLGTQYGPSLGATITAVLLASRARGTSVLTDPSVEPEVEHVVRFLNRAGASVQWRDGCLVVTGVPTLSGAVYRTPPDRIEAGTLLIAAAATSGTVSLGGVGLPDLTPGFVHWLAQVGVNLFESEGNVAIEVMDDLRAADVITGPHPGFPTDLQPQATALLTALPGQAAVVERVHRRRYSHVPGLRAFGARIEQNGVSLQVMDATRLHGVAVAGDDIRCVAALLTAALAARGESYIGGLDQLRRGYVDLPGKLAALGADLELVVS